MSILSKFDDYCIHQTTQPLAQPVTSDKNYYDRYWFNGFDKDGGFCFEIGFGIYPNRFVMDGHFSVVVGGKQYAFHSSRRAPEDRSETFIGPLAIEVVEPMKSLRVQLQDNETGIACDLLFIARSCANLEPKNYLAEGVHVVMETTRFTQFGRWQGWFSIDGVRTVVDQAATLGVRDKSWGVRPVGEPQGGAPGLPDQEPGVYWCWAPIHFDDFCTHFATFEDHDGNPTQLSGHKFPVYNRLEEVPVGREPGEVTMDKALHRIKWRKGTRQAASAEIELYKGDEKMLIELEPMLTFYMLGIGYQHPEWAHAVWKGDNVFAREEWLIDELDPLDYKHIHNQQIVRARCGELQGVGTLETMVFGRHDPSGFKDIFDGAE